MAVISSALLGKHRAHPQRLCQQELEEGRHISARGASASGIILRPAFSIQVIGNKALESPLLALHVIVGAHLQPIAFTQGSGKVQ